MQGVLTNDLSVLKNNGVIQPHLLSSWRWLTISSFTAMRKIVFIGYKRREYGKDYNFLKERYPESVVLEDLSAEFALIAIQGPSLEILKNYDRRCSSFKHKAVQFFTGC